MPPTAWSIAELHEQREKLSNSYQELLDEFSAEELRTVGNYTVGRLIGKGSFGKVYLATHKLTNGSKVVLKSAKKEDPNLAREIHHHRQFIHPHIARLYEVIVTESLVWLVLEYCPGDELYHHILENGRMPEDKVQKTFTQLVGAVSYVHMKGCVHRDLKLENILLDKHGNVKLVDFGFTREYKGSSSYLQTWCGTVCYSAPEMVKGEKYAGEKVDIWSLGIILYALLAGELPFDDDDEAVTKERILKEDASFPDHFPTGAKDLIDKMLSKRPLLRPAMADILRHAWLSEHSPQQQEILKLQQPAPFSTQLEKDTLHRLRGAAVNTDTVMEHVLAQRCDALAGWWAILMEKEERRERRRQRRRREREKEEKVLKRLSTASGRLLAAPMLREINEGVEEGASPGSPQMGRGRGSKRSSLNVRHTRDGSSVDTTGLPRVSELTTLPELKTPTAVPRPASRSTSSSRRRPIPSSGAESKPGSTLREVQQIDTLPPLKTQDLKRKRIYKTPLKEHLGMIKAWFKDPARRSRSYAGPESERAVATLQQHRRESEAPLSSNGCLKMNEQDVIPEETAVGRPDLLSLSTIAPQARLSTASSNASTHSNISAGHFPPNPDRLSMSPKPPAHNSYRRRSGLNGRKSTSSSVSSVRSIRVHMSAHSKASSTSSTSISIASPNLSATTGSMTRARSRDGQEIGSASQPVAVPMALGITGPSSATPLSKTNRRPTPNSLGALPTFADIGTSPVGSPFSGLGPPSPGIHPVFARQRRKVFKGPAQLSGSPRNRGTHLAADGAAEGRDSRRKSGGILEEEDEEDTHENLAHLRYHQSHGTASKRNSRIGTEVIAVLSEEDVADTEDLEVEEVESFEPVSGETEIGYFGGHEPTTEDRLESRVHARTIKS